MAASESFDWQFTVEPACVSAYDYVDQTIDTYGLVTLSAPSGTTTQSVTFQIFDQTTVKTAPSIATLLVSLDVTVKAGLVFEGAHSDLML